MSGAPRRPATWRPPSSIGYEESSSLVLCRPNPPPLDHGPSLHRLRPPRDGRDQPAARHRRRLGRPRARRQRDRRGGHGGGPAPRPPAADDPPRGGHVRGPVVAEGPTTT